MQVYKLENYDQMSEKAAQIIAKEMQQKPNCVLGLATGSTPIGIYKRLVQAHKDGNLDFSQVVTVNLDEYKGMAPDHEQSYYHFMCHHLFSHVNIDLKNVNLPDGLAADEFTECARYDAVLQAVGKRDIQVLGIGENGHIGFNEPSDIFTKTSYCAKLTDSTINANARLFEHKDEVPEYAYTMGIKQIVNAKTVIILASGEKKHAILKQALEGEITPMLPASILQLCENLIVITDESHQ